MLLVADFKASIIAFFLDLRQNKPSRQGGEIADTLRIRDIS
jgi:hypothetical protein